MLDVLVEIVDARHAAELMVGISFHPQRIFNERVGIRRSPAPSIVRAGFSNSGLVSRPHGRAAEARSKADV
jgi:hypothetical protein